MEQFILWNLAQRLDLILLINMLLNIKIIFWRMNVWSDVDRMMQAVLASKQSNLVISSPTTETYFGWNNIHYYHYIRNY